jgi:hypothetical protein
MFRAWRHLWLLSIESQYVVAMRAIKLASGGPPALDEAWRIVAEKSAATAEIPQHMLYARLPLALAVVYRKMVRTNLRRLQRGTTGTKGKSI